MADLVPLWSPLLLDVLLVVVVVVVAVFVLVVAVLVVVVVGSTRLDSTRLGDASAAGVVGGDDDRRSSALPEHQWRRVRFSNLCCPSRSLVHRSGGVRSSFSFLFQSAFARSLSLHATPPPLGDDLEALFSSSPWD
jgi:hypothetical protein